jgi:hypothetical protein
LKLLHDNLLQLPLSLQVLEGRFTLGLSQGMLKKASCYRQDLEELFSPRQLSL